MISLKKVLFSILTAYLAYQVKLQVYPGKLPVSPVVSLENGQVQGNIRSSRDGHVFYEFLGIPYAKPPIGELRYEVRRKAFFC